MSDKKTSKEVIKDFLNFSKKYFLYLRTVSTNGTIITYDDEFINKLIEEFVESEPEKKKLLEAEVKQLYSEQHK